MHITKSLRVTPNVLTPIAYCFLAFAGVNLGLNVYGAAFINDPSYLRSIAITGNTIAALWMLLWIFKNIVHEKEVRLLVKTLKAKDEIFHHLVKFCEKALYEAELERKKDV